jgi:hypothetical protein
MEELKIPFISVDQRNQRQKILSLCLNALRMKAEDI